jgi:TrmH family RNA methyltransferase
MIFAKNQCTTGAYEAEASREWGELMEITSRQNVRFKDWLSLLEARAIKKSARALVSGPKLVDEFLRDRAEAVQECLAPLKSAAPRAVKTFFLSAPLFKELDVLGTGSPLLVVETPGVSEWVIEPPRGLQLIVALSDPGNLGALLRSAEAFEAARVVLCEESSSPFLPKVTRGAALANFRVPLARTGSIRDLRVEGGFALDMRGEDIRGFKWPRDLYLVLGEEGRGLPEGLAVTKIKIPMAGHVESLNASAAASIALFSYRSSRE